MRTTVPCSLVFSLLGDLPYDRCGRMNTPDEDKSSLKDGIENPRTIVRSISPPPSPIDDNKPLRGKQTINFVVNKSGNIQSIDSAQVRRFVGYTELADSIQKLPSISLDRTSLAHAVRINEGTKLFFSLMDPISISRLNEKDSDGNTPLHIAVLLGQLDVAKMLVRRGAYGSYVDTIGSKINSKNERGVTPLHHAVCRTEHLHLLCAEFLMMNGAKSDAKTKEGQVKRLIFDSNRLLSIMRYVKEVTKDSELSIFHMFSYYADGELM